jgi:tyrosine-protein kinase Etk/Wzc
MSANESLDIIATIRKGWLAIFLFTSLAIGASIAYALLSPSWYEGRLTVVPSRPQESGMMALADKLPAISALDTSGSNQVQRISAVLTSYSVTDEVITRFNLMERYGTEHIEHARKELWQHCSTSVEKKSGVVTLICEDRDPKMAMEITRYFGEVGNRVFGRVSASSAREERKFLEDQVLKAREDVDQASKRLREFQENHKVIDLPEQSKAVISAMASIKGDMLTKQLQLSYLTSFSSPVEANVAQLQQQIAIMEAKLRQLEESPDKVPPKQPRNDAHGSANADFFPDALKVPELRYELEQLMREQKIRETVFALLTQRYEIAKVDEARDTSTFQILDNATMPTFRSRPKRRKIVMMGAVAGVGIALLWILVPAWRRNQLANRANA